MRFNPLVEAGLNSENVADRGNYQVYCERGRADKEREVCVGKRQLLAIDGQQRRKKDRIELNEE